MLGATACNKFGRVTLKDGFLASVYYRALKPRKFDNIGNQYIKVGSIAKFVENESGDHGRSGMRTIMFISWPGYHTSKHSLKMFITDYWLGQVGGSLIVLIKTSWSFFYV